MLLPSGMQKYCRVPPPRGSEGNMVGWGLMSGLPTLQWLVVLHSNWEYAYHFSIRLCLYRYYTLAKCWCPRRFHLRVRPLGICILRVRVKEQPNDCIQPNATNNTLIARKNQHWGWVATMWMPSGLHIISLCVCRKWLGILHCDCWDHPATVRVRSGELRYCYSEWSWLHWIHWTSYQAISLTFIHRINCRSNQAIFNTINCHSCPVWNSSTRLY